MKFKLTKTIGVFLAALVLVLAASASSQAAKPYADNATLLKQTTAAGLALEGRRPGEVLCRSAAYTTNGTEYNGTTVQMVKVPAGAMIMDFHVYTQSFGSTGNFTLAFGDDDDADRFITAYNATNGNQYIFQSLGMLNATWWNENASSSQPSLIGHRFTNSAGFHYVFEAEDTFDLQIEKVASVSTAERVPAGVQIRVDVFYKMIGGIADENAAF
jgi:hypothetical protein